MWVRHRIGLSVWLILLNILSCRWLLSQIAEGSYFLWLRTILLCVCVCVCVYYILFSHLSVDGHLDCFYISAYVSSAAVNMGMKIYLQDTDFVSFRYIPRNGIVRSYGFLFIISWRNSELFSMLAAPIYIPTNSV